MWKSGRAQYDEFEGIAWRWQSIGGAMMKAPMAQQSVGPNPTDRGKKWEQTTFAGGPNMRSRTPLPDRYSERSYEGWRSGSGLITEYGSPAPLIVNADWCVSLRPESHLANGGWGYFGCLAAEKSIPYPGGSGLRLWRASRTSETEPARHDQAHPSLVCFMVRLNKKAP